MIKQYGKWWVQTTEQKVYRTPNFGDPYTGVLTIKVVNGEVHVEGLMLQYPNQKATKSDLKSLKEIIKDLGYDTFIYKNGTDLK
jgi:hypothetical protein|tara:strand:- start:2431 stop:2682 length:252 start_codon:yes stop_codon:yes gene_type:complete